MINYESPLIEKNLIDADILVAGCGTGEAIIVAQHNKKSNVVGIDFSESSIAIAKSIKRKRNIKNLTLFVKDIREMNFLIQFDRILSVGVLHHIPDVSLAIDKIYDSLKSGGSFSGMVYADDRPDYIRTVNQMNFLTVGQLRTFLNKHTNDWYERHTKDDEELADTWMHPYFIEYDEQRLKTLLCMFADVQVVRNDNKLYFLAIK